MSRHESLFKVPGLDPAGKKSFQREQLCEFTLPLATSLMEGGFVAVVAAKTFDAQPWVIAVISAAPMFGQLSSFFWNRITTGCWSVSGTRDGSGAQRLLRHPAR